MTKFYFLFLTLSSFRQMENFKAITELERRISLLGKLPITKNNWKRVGNEKACMNINFGPAKYQHTFVLDRTGMQLLTLAYHKDFGFWLPSGKQCEILNFCWVSDKKFWYQQEVEQTWSSQRPFCYSKFEKLADDTQISIPFECYWTVLALWDIIIVNIVSFS